MYICIYHIGDRILKKKILMSYLISSKVNSHCFPITCICGMHFDIH